jgi:alkylhydroperoxidase family enzyme
MIEKLAAQNVEIGKFAPMRKQQDRCHACRQWLRRTVLRVQSGWKLQFHGTPEKKQVRASIIWTPAVDSHCSECERQNHLKQAFVQALHDYGMRWSEFDSLPTMNHQGEVILKMAAAGVLDLSQVVQQPCLWRSMHLYMASRIATFPMDSCKERIARRYGENATSMSGPAGANL